MANSTAPLSAVRGQRQQRRDGAGDTLRVLRLGLPQSINHGRLGACLAVLLCAASHTTAAQQGLNPHQGVEVAVADAGARVRWVDGVVAQPGMYALGDRQALRATQLAGVVGDGQQGADHTAYKRADEARKQVVQADVHWGSALLGGILGGVVGFYLTQMLQRLCRRKEADAYRGHVPPRPVPDHAPIPPNGPGASA